MPAGARSGLDVEREARLRFEDARGELLHRRDGAVVAAGEGAEPRIGGAVGAGCLGGLLTHLGPARLRVRGREEGAYDSPTGDVVGVGGFGGKEEREVRFRGSSGRGGADGGDVGGLGRGRRDHRPHDGQAAEGRLEVGAVAARRGEQDEPEQQGQVLAHIRSSGARGHGRRDG